MEPISSETIGHYLRRTRENGGHGSIAGLAKVIGVDKNTLQGYEAGKVLPDVDFLAAFADRTGVDFNELLRLRLASGKNDESRAMAEKVNVYKDIHEDRPRDRVEEVIPAWSAESYIETAIQIAEEQLQREGKVLPPRIKARFLKATIDAYRALPEESRGEAFPAIVEVLLNTFR